MGRVTPPSRKTGRKGDRVSPSNRDSIGSWLDVLTSMLSIPEGEREQVRDELEDHLRSRVDDLLITGTEEHEAVRIAVAELGETAELAKHISHAHSRANPRRRIMNIALITAAIAGLSVGGISLQNQEGTGVLPGGESGGRLVHAEDGAQDQERVHTFALGSTSAYRVLEEIAIGFDRSFQVSRKVKNTDTERALAFQTRSFDGEMTLDQAVEAFHKAFDAVSGGFNVQVTDDAVLFQTEEEYQRSRIVTRVLPLSDWVERDELYDYAKSLENLLSVKHDLSLASIEVVNETIVVAALPEIHEEILKMVIELDAVVEQRKIEQQKAIENDRAYREQYLAREHEEHLMRQAEQEAKTQKTIARLQSELDHARKELLMSKAHLRVVQQKKDAMDRGGSSGELEFKELVAQLNDLQMAIDEVRLELDEREERYGYLRGRLLETQYAHLFQGLD